MSELQLEGFAAERESHDLMPETDSEDRFLSEQAPNIPDRIVHGFRIARTIGQKNSVGIQIQHVLGRSRRRHDRDARAAVHEIAEDVGLDSEVVRHDVSDVLLRIAQAWKTR